MKKIIFLLQFLYVLSAAAQPFKEDIERFKEQDAVLMPAKNQILFVGSSSFTKWTDVQDYFPQYKIINRGFGGSTLPDVIRYTDDVIKPYHAKQIVIYCGENDLASSDTVTAKMVFQRFKKLFSIIRNDNPAVPVAFVSLKPSPSRKHLWTKMQQANKLIKNFLAKQKRTAFIDVYHKMFNKDGTVMQDVFIEDNLHMNEKGYRIWQKAIAPVLVK